MRSLAAIQAENREAARVAAEEGKVPFSYYAPTEVEEYDTFPFPYLGDHVPEGWELVEQHFADASGLGAPDEPALTQGQLEAVIRDAIADDPRTGWAIISVGQFQVWVGQYRRTETETERLAS